MLLFPFLRIIKKTKIIHFLYWPGHRGHRSSISYGPLVLHLQCPINVPVYGGHNQNCNRIAVSGLYDDKRLIDL